MKNKLLVLSIIPLLITMVALPVLPDLVPMHYDINGSVNRWGSKYENLFIPIIIIFVDVVLVKSSSDQNKKPTPMTSINSNNKNENNHALRIGIIITLIFALFQILVIYQAFAIGKPELRLLTFNMTRLPHFVCGTLLIALGIMIKRIPYNQSIGVRLSWSMYNNNTWNRCNCFGGIAGIVTGVLIITTSIIVSASMASYAMIFYIILWVVSVILYAYYVYKKEIHGL